MPKKFYARTNKNTGFEKQVTKNERRAALSREIQDRMAQTNQAPEKATRTQEELDDDNLPLANAAQPYQMSTSRNLRLNLTQWLADNKGDLSLEVLLLIICAFQYSTMSARTSSQISRTTFLDGSKKHQITSSLLKSGANSRSKTTQFIPIRLCGLTTRHTMFDESKIQSIPEPSPT